MTDSIGAVRLAFLVFCLILGGPFRLAAQVEGVLPPGDKTPILRLSAGGPAGYLTGLAWNPDESALFAASWDKQVHVWTRSQADGAFSYNAEVTFRVPVGGGLDGALSDIDISEDGQWLATAGRGLSRNDMGTRREGWIIAQFNLLNDEERQDRGLIHIFNLREKKVHLLRGHRGEVRALKFVQGTAGDKLKLASLADEGAHPEVHGVVRLWDVGKEQQLASLDSLPKQLINDGKIPVAIGLNPKLAAWQTDQDGQIRIAFAMYKFPDALVWTPFLQNAAKRIQGRAPNPTESNSLSVAAASAGLLVGRQGGMSLWDGMANTAVAKLPLSSEQVVRNIAWQPGGEKGRQLAAALVMTRNKNQSYLYRLLTIEARSDAPKLTVIGNRDGQKIYEGDLRELTLSTGKSRVAVAGMPGEEILIFDWNQLKAGGDAKPLTLTALNRRISSAAFVKSSDDPPHWGVALSPEPQSVKSDGWLKHRKLRVFDVSNRQLSPSEGWKLSQPKPGTWQVSSLEQASKSGVFTITDGAGAAVKIDINQWESAGRRHLPTASVFCPPVEARATPLLIVASALNGEIYLRGFRADTGAELFWFTGHIGPIRDLAVSEDGRRMLSVSEDRTLGLWSLVELDQVLDRGSPGNVIVEAVDNTLRVRDAGRASDLQKNDEILGLVEPNETLPMGSFRQFNQEFRRKKPGDQLTFDIRRAGALKQAKLDVSQAVRERKPLGTLFLAEIAPDQISWAAWQPDGRFDSSGAEAEQRLGWHFNTGNPAEPTQFVSVDQYREEFFTPGLLQPLIDPPGSPDVEERPLPELSLLLRSIDGEDEKQLELDDAEKYRLQAPRLRVIVSTDRDIPLKQLDSMRWFWGGPDEPQKSGKFTWDDYGSWMADIDGIPLNYQEIPLRVELRTTGVTPRTAAVSAQVLTLPPPPQVTVTDQGTEKLLLPETQTAASKLMLDVQVNERADVTLSLRQDGTIGATQTKEIVPGKTAEFPLELKLGDNEVVVKAVNRNARPETERDETTVATYLIRRTETNLDVVVNAVTATDDPDQKNLLQSGTTIITTQFPKVRVTGMIRANVPIANAEFSYCTDKRKEQPQQKLLEFSEVLALKPGEHTWKLTADSNGKSISKFLTVEYRPPLPKLASVRFRELLVPGVQFPLKKKAGNNLYAGWHEPLLEITADLLSPGDNQSVPDYAIGITVNGKAHAVPKSALNLADPQKHQLHTQVPLVVGFNRVRLVVRNAFETEPLFEEYEVRYLRPPVVADCKLPENGIVKNPVTIQGTIRSIPDLEHVQVDVNGAPNAAKFEKAAGVDDEWTFKTEALTLPEKSTVIIHASNTETATLQEFSREVLVNQPVAKAEIEIYLNELGATTNETPLKLDLEFRSQRVPIQRVEIYDAAGRKVDEIVAPGRMKDPLVFQWKPELVLEEGAGNHFEIRAYDANQGEPATRRFSISYVRPARGLQITSVDDFVPVLTHRGWELQPGDRVQASPAKLKGRLKLEQDQDSNESVSIKAIVNGIHRQTIKLSPERNWEFELKLVLNWKKENRIDLQVLGPKIPVEAKTLFAGCVQPDEEQELFLFLISPKERQLKEHVHQALGAKEYSAGKYEARNAGFKRVHCIDGCNLVGSDAVTHKVLRNLRELIQPEIKKLKVSNPVVLIFYHGKDHVTADRSLLLATARDYDDFTGQASGSAASQLTDRKIEECARLLHAGNLLFVEVEERKQSPHLWQEPEDIAVFRRTIKDRETFPLLADLNPVLPKVAKLENVRSSLRTRWDEESSKVALTTLDAASLYVPSFMKSLHFGGGDE